jgi:hypothetical protein
MRILKEGVSFEEILESYENEHHGWKGYEIGLEYLTSANRRCNGRWTLVLLSGADIVNVVLPSHNHPCTPNGSTCTGKTSGLLVRRHIRSGEFHYIGREASTRWASGPDLSMMADAGVLDPTHETFREYGRVVDKKYLDELRTQAKQFSTKRSLANPQLPSARSGISRMGKTSLDLGIFEN